MTTDLAERTANGDSHSPLQPQVEVKENGVGLDAMGKDEAKTSAEEASVAPAVVNGGGSGSGGSTDKNETTEGEPPEEGSESKPDDEDDEPIDPAKHVEAHILSKIDPEFLDYFINTIIRNAPKHEVTIPMIRENPEKYRAPLAVDASDHDRVADHKVTSADGTEITARVYLPDPEQHGPGPYPMHMNFHGGGFVLGDLCADGHFCLAIRDAGIAAIDVDYRLCPEARWGKCIEDAWAALNWARDSATTLNIDPNSISIGGISAGGHISLALQHIARDASFPLRLCLPTVPAVTDALSYTYYTDSPYPSFHEFYRAPILPWSRIQFFSKQCMPEEGLAHLKAVVPDFWLAPIKATRWDGLCDTFIRTAEIDPLRDEGEAYGMKLIATGNKCTMKRYLGSPHTFMYMKFMRQKVAFDEDTIAALKAAHGVR